MLYTGAAIHSRSSRSCHCNLLCSILDAVWQIGNPLAASASLHSQERREYQAFPAQTYHASKMFTRPEASAAGIRHEVCSTILHQTEPNDRQNVRWRHQLTACSTSSTGIYDIRHHLLSRSFGEPFGAVIKASTSLVEATASSHIADRQVAGAAVDVVVTADCLRQRATGPSEAVAKVLTHAAAGASCSKGNKISSRQRQR